MQGGFSNTSRRDFLKWAFGLAVGGLLAACGIQSRSAPIPPSAGAPLSTSPPLTAAPHSQVAIPACVVTPQQTSGPYFVDEMLNRSDIRSDPSNGWSKEGVPLHLVFNV